MTRFSRALAWLAVLPYVLAAQGGFGGEVLCVGGSGRVAFEASLEGHCRDCLDDCCDAAGAPEEVGHRLTGVSSPCRCCFDVSIPGLPEAAVPPPSSASGAGPDFRASSSPCAFEAIPGLDLPVMSACESPPRDWLSPSMSCLRSVVLLV